eukprot:CAMPEP_0175921572 /NCGR_PEP_ID=MMETSP0108-20121206/13545_1 /TAXON_ID=195067 ORGANISM="Goniomonas pacifica, Strain CCMP1869" /NCGR_SAMPLE_ID=MMETSP0108 /ASSEMBLY_ACC=CAM_ASM_000204 /LENGTH=73 /DNA_ID=CAMNT_0017244387 /DNA_START=242 /DNA_END=460 /DNA_ORIENTATION=-
MNSLQDASRNPLDDPAMAQTKDAVRTVRWCVARVVCTLDVGWGGGTRSVSIFAVVHVTIQLSGSTRQDLAEAT